MKTSLFLCALSLAAGIAQAQISAPMRSDETPIDVSQLRLEAATAAQEAAAAQKRSELAEARYRAGVETQDAVLDAQMAALQASSRAKQLQQAVQISAPLLRRVTVQMRQAQAAQAARLLSTVGQVAVDIDQQAPSTLRFTVSARDARLLDVLEQLARAAHLEIAGKEGGFTLRPWPRMQVGSRSVETAGSSAPWSLELAPWVRRLRGVAAAPAASARSVAGQPPSVTAVGDRRLAFVRPGTGPKGQPGYWLTIYRLAPHALVRESATFAPNKE